MLTSLEIRFSLSFFLLRHNVQLNCYRTITTTTTTKTAANDEWLLFLSLRVNRAIFLVYCFTVTLPINGDEESRFSPFIDWLK